MSIVISANRLTDGSVIYLTRSGNWSDQFSDAKVYAEEEREHGRSLGLSAEENNIVVGSYEVAVDPADQAQPTRLRERIRSQGPTIDPISNHLVGDHQSKPSGGPEG